ncbi:hypothetical protein KY348_05835 [Candidatus Woesearchaeota archaeon]|nr:hypothetical protein [Candidatus Woesearchaeota archaeon]
MNVFEYIKHQKKVFVKKSDEIEYLVNHIEKNVKKGLVKEGAVKGELIEIAKAYDSGHFTEALSRVKNLSEKIH